MLKKANKIEDILSELDSILRKPGKMRFLHQLFHNALRARAKNLSIIKTSNNLIIEDDGHGNDHPEYLFHINTDCFGNYFGGLFSPFMVCNKIEVQSNGFSIVCDLKKVLEENDFSLEIQENQFSNGFRVILSDFHHDVTVKDIEEEISRYEFEEPLNIDFNQE